MLRTSPLPLAVLLCVAVALAQEGRAESAFVLELPERMGTVPAATYDGAGHRIGTARVIMEELDNGTFRMSAQSGEQDGARTLATAEFESVTRGKTVRLTREESRSFDPDGQSLGVLTIDHVAGLASCLDSTGRLAGEIQLDGRDRVVNVPMNLLFLPLVRGDTDKLDFQIFLCRQGGARLLDFDAWVEGKSIGSSGAGAVEVRYSPDFGNVVSIVARGFVPRLSFWFDRHAPHGWVGHRIPLYSGGPEVMVVREGIPSAALPQ